MSSQRTFDVLPTTRPVCFSGLRSKLRITPRSFSQVDFVRLIPFNLYEYFGFCRPKWKTEHSATFGESCHSSSFSVRASKSFWIFDEALTSPKSFVPFANRLKSVWEMGFMQVSMYMTNKTGPRTLPCGTPLVALIHVDSMSATLTDIFLSFNYAESQFLSCPLIQTSKQLMSFCKDIQLKALSRSIRIIHFPFLLRRSFTWDRFPKLGNLHCSNEIWKSIARGSHSSSLSSFRIKDGVPKGLSAFDPFLPFIAL